MSENAPLPSAETIAAPMAGQDGTNGWDAVCAMNLKQVNALFLQQYLQNGPLHPATNLRVALKIGQTSWILDIELGPPKVAFETVSQEAILEMELVSGSLITFVEKGQDLIIQSAVQIRPGESKLTGPVALTKIQVKVGELGTVVADLGASAYSPEIAGVEPKSVLTEEIGQAVRTFFKATETYYPLGTITPSTDLSAFLKPTDFEFYTQPNPLIGGDACVVLLIQTNGQKGKREKLEPYPISKEHSAALILSGKVVSGLLVEYLNQVFAPLGSKFSVQQTETSWAVSSSSGEIYFGQIGDPVRKITDYFFSSNPEEVRIPTEGFTAGPSEGKLVAKWKWDGEQSWAKWLPDSAMDVPTYPYAYVGSTIHVDHQQTGTPKVDSKNSNKVTFEGESTTSVNLEATSPIDKIVGLPGRVEDRFKEGIQSKLEPILKKIQLPAVDTFALQHLLFPSRNELRLTEAALPSDLRLTGGLVPVIELTPAEANVAPGKSVQFQAIGRPATDFLWEVLPHVGRIDKDGKYTAPETVSEAKLVVVTAVCRDDEKLIGKAMVLVYQQAASGGVAVAPSAALVTPGNEVEFSTKDAMGNDVSVTWELAPNLGKMESKRHATGRYIYKAPDSLKEATKITAKAANTDKHGEAQIQLVPRVEVTVTPPQASVKLGGSVELKAKADGVKEPQFRWVVDPQGAGSVKAHDDVSQATYEAPKVAPEKKQITVYAYILQDGAGMDGADITITG